ncbi:Short-chain dehydrogenase [Ekhidna lutea]|uniref:Short-chain dehydrogenase n=1 Tax=Ekhidna lutea TaxID=447679 RepID=A0A239HXR6_EKHLU|nr:SDR family oxidoreductase [Ekhidna lutea]SNS86032.1 Short-chain dehydrogenase [Ekhidna lutea]
MTKIKDSVVWVTGASSGIGEQLAYQLAEKGAKLIISARRKEELDRVKSNCKSETVETLSLDLEDEFSLKQRAKEAGTIFGEVDILINNGGISQRDTILNTSLEVDRRLMEVNYFGSITLSKTLLPKMVERKKGHHVIVTSTVGIINTPFRSGYGASKHALHGFYDALRAEHHNDNIKVTIVLPGYIKTNISYNALVGDGSQQNKMDPGQAKGMSPEKCARLIIKAIENNKTEVYIGGAKEKLGIYLKRFWPKAAAKAVRKLRVK